MTTIELSVTASGVRTTDTGASFRGRPGVDLDVTVLLSDGRTLTGEVTLLPSETGSGYAIWGGPDNWLDGRTWGVVRDLEDYRTVLDAIESAAVDAAGEVQG